MTISRNATVDVARGFTVFIMPGVHSVLYYSNEKTRRSWLGKLLGFLAEGPGAQLFMFLMGASVTLGRKKTTSQILKRSVVLFVHSLLLNFLRLVVPYKLGLLPEQLLKDAGMSSGRKRIQKLTFLGDILQLSAISYPIIALLNRSQKNTQLPIALALMIAVYSPKMWDGRSRYPVISYCLRLLGGQPPEVFFPVFPWLTYALAGLAWGQYLKTSSERGLYQKTAIAGIILILTGKYLQQHEPLSWNSSFYRLGTGGTMAHLGIVLLWMTLTHVAVKKVKWNRFFKLLLWLSKHITRVYFIQWILVLWLLPLFGYRKSGLFKSLLSMMVNTVLTFKTIKLKNPLIWKQFMISQASG